MTSSSRKRSGSLVKPKSIEREKTDINREALVNKVEQASESFSFRRSRRTTAALLIALIVHVLAFISIAFFIKTKYEPQEFIGVEWVEVPAPVLREIQRRPINKLFQQEFNTRDITAKSTPTFSEPAPDITGAVAKGPDLVPTKVRLNLSRNPSETLAAVTTDADIPKNIGDFTVSVGSGASGAPGGTGLGGGTEDGVASAFGRGGSGRGGGGLSLVRETGASGLGDISGEQFTDLITIPENKLGAILVGEGRDIMGYIRLIRLKHSLSDWWQDPTAMPSFMDWLKEHTRIRADMKVAGGTLPLTDPRILEAPLVFMTGHDKDITISHNMVKGGPLTNSFSQEERAALRKYIIESKGTLFFDDCGFNGLFAAKVEEELRIIFPEYDLKHIPYDHEIYHIYYELPKPPTGGDIFWNSENNPQVTKFPYQRGMAVDRRLAIVFNRKDYLCAMETAEIPSRTMLRLRRSIDVHKFMTNLLVYAMKYGGNTDRSDYIARK
ncbi:MAG: DUF4159 domain-containing protein [Candidatus Poribacteria bacterium]